MRAIFLLFSFLLISASVSADNTVTYTCSNACYNYHAHKCSSPIDNCGYSCITVCEFFSGDIVSQRDLRCISLGKSCREIFACLGY